MLVDTKEKLMQIQGYGNANSEIGMYLSCSETVRQQGKGPMEASWHTGLHPWQEVFEFNPPESIMRFLSEIFSELLGCISGCRQLICKT